MQYRERFFTCHVTPCYWVRMARYHTLKRSTEDRTQESGGNRAYKDMSAKYGINFRADMKRYPGKLWQVTAQNSNKPGLHTSNIAGAVDREDLHQIPILTVIFTSVWIGSTARFDKERPKRLWHVTPGPLFDTAKTGGEVTVSCVNKSLIRFGCQPKSYPV